MNILLINLLLTSTHVKAQTTSLRAFADTVRQVYSNMSFAGVDMSVTGVNLIEIPYGLSFARYDRESSDRQILFNFRHFLNRHWSDDANFIRRDSLRRVCREIIDGVLAHEWAHHYMGHTFEQNSVLKERNADILAGRILFDHYPSGKNGLDTIALKRSIRLLDALGTSNSLYHLSKDNRKGLLIKGYITSWLLEYSKELKGEVQLDKLDKELKKEITDSLIADKYRIIRLSSLENSIKFRNEAVQLTERHLSKNVSNYFDIILMINKIDSTIKEQVSSPIVSDTTNLINRIVQLKKYYNYNAKIDTIGISDLIQENKKKVSENIRKNIDRRSLEALYNLLYFEDGLHNKDTFEAIPFVRKKLSAFIRPDPPLSVTATHAFWYVLSYGGVQFEINYRDVANIDDRQPNNLVAMYQGRDKRYTSLRKVVSKKGDGFLYRFTMDDDNYFIDKYHHLWTETLGAKLINNKIFLQRYTIKL